jgi:uncharacterized membrane protein (UPF0127 family)
MKLRNLDKDCLLADDLRVANTFFSRLKGLLGTASLPPGGGLLIQPCNSVHMFGMRYAIDVLFLDASEAVIRVCHSLRPNQMAYCRQAASVVELPAGTAEATGTAAGHRLEFQF